MFTSGGIALIFLLIINTLALDQYCISHKTIHRAAAAPDPEIRREMPHEQINSFARPRNKSWRRH